VKLNHESDEPKQENSGQWLPRTDFGILVGLVDRWGHIERKLGGYVRLYD
jgi:hypothetical protein